MIRNRGFKIKSKEDFQVMEEGGKILAKVKNALKEKVKVGENAQKLDQLAEQMIFDMGAKPSFKMVKDYYWTTCINRNEGVVHGIPHKSLFFKEGDIVSVDVGVFYKDFHTDTSFSVCVGNFPEKEKFLQVGENALDKAIKKAVPGGRIFDISKAIEDVLVKNDLSPIKTLVGHGVGRELHENPQIPCFTVGKREDSPEIPVGAAMAIEVMYGAGSGDIELQSDGWTISSSDGKITGLFEDTVIILKNGPKILTR